MKLYRMNEFPEFPFKNWEDIRDIALNKLREHYAEDIPVPVPIIDMIEMEGIEITEKESRFPEGYFDRFEKKPAGFSLIPLKIMWVDEVEAKLRQRQRFTYAHEFGHFCLHSIPLSAPDSAEFQKKNEYILDRQADYFAGCLLMPPSLTFPLWEKLTGLQHGTFDSRLEQCHNMDLEHQIARENEETHKPFEWIYLDYYKEHEPKNYELIATLAETFDISFAACRVNLRKMQMPLWQY
jgi:hypothetical protein